MKEGYMRLLFIRHAEPDYATDTLTEKGLREAALLVPRMEKETFDICYCSTMNRARQTAAPFLEKLGREAIYCDWLREFEHPVTLPDGNINPIAWDLDPHIWTGQDVHFDKDNWYESELAKTGPLKDYALAVNKGIDCVLAENGYVYREKNLFDVTESNHRTLLFVCHFGVMSVILGHLLGLSPMQLWHVTGAPCTSLTQIYTEEIVPGTATFKINFYGDISHLYVAGEPIGFNPRLTECAGDPPQRTYQGKSF